MRCFPRVLPSPSCFPGCRFSSAAIVARSWWRRTRQVVGISSLRLEVRLAQTTRRVSMRCRTSRLAELVAPRPRVESQPVVAIRVPAGSRPQPGEQEVAGLPMVATVATARSSRPRSATTGRCSTTATTVAAPRTASTLLTAATESSTVRSNVTTESWTARTAAAPRIASSLPTAATESSPVRSNVTTATRMAWMAFARSTARRSFLPP